MAINKITKLLFVIALILPAVNGMNIEQGIKEFDDYVAAQPNYGEEVPNAGYAPLNELRVINELTPSHTAVIFGGSGPDIGREFGIGDDKHYTVNIYSDEKPDLLADMNNSEHLRGIESGRFKLVIAGNIPLCCFKGTFFPNAWRLLEVGGFLIINTLHPYEIADARVGAINSCMALFGFVPDLSQIPEQFPRLNKIGFGEDQVGTIESPAVSIFRKVPLGL